MDLLRDRPPGAAAVFVADTARTTRASPEATRDARRARRASKKSSTVAVPDTVDAFPFARTDTAALTGDAEGTGTHGTFRAAELRALVRTTNVVVFSAPSTTAPGHTRAAFALASAYLRLGPLAHAVRTTHIMPAVGAHIERGTVNWRKERYNAVSMQYIAPRWEMDLASYMRTERAPRGRMNRAVRADMAVQLCYGMGVMHANGCYHGDFKPQNVIVYSSDPARVAFPLLAIIDFDSVDVHTYAGKVLGASMMERSTPGYFPPEWPTYFTATGEVGAMDLHKETWFVPELIRPSDIPMTPAHDSWELGAVLFELFFGSKLTHEHKKAHAYFRAGGPAGGAPRREASFFNEDMAKRLLLQWHPWLGDRQDLLTPASRLFLRDLQLAQRQLAEKVQMVSMHDAILRTIVTAVMSNVSSDPAYLSTDTFIDYMLGMRPSVNLQNPVASGMGPQYTTVQLGAIRTVLVGLLAHNPTERILPIVAWIHLRRAFAAQSEVLADPVADARMGARVFSTQGLVVRFSDSPLTRLSGEDATLFTYALLDVRSLTAQGARVSVWRTLHGLLPTVHDQYFNNTPYGTHTGTVLALAILSRALTMAALCIARTHTWTPEQRDACVYIGIALESSQLLTDQSMHILGSALFATAADVPSTKWVNLHEAVMRNADEWFAYDFCVVHTWGVLTTARAYLSAANGGVARVSTTLRELTESGLYNDEFTTNAYTFFMGTSAAQLMDMHSLAASPTTTEMASLAQTTTTTAQSYLDSLHRAIWSMNMTVRSIRAHAAPHNVPLAAAPVRALAPSPVAPNVAAQRVAVALGRRAAIGRRRIGGAGSSLGGRGGGGGGGGGVGQ